MTAASGLRRAFKSVLRHGAAVAGRLGGTAAGPRVLCYHGVCERPVDEWSVTPSQLTRHMELVAASYSPVSVDAIVDWVVDGRRLPERAVAVTFDDGFRDVLEHAAPIMARFGVPGAAFIPSAIVSGGPPDASYAPTRPFMDWPEVVRLAESGWTIGSHSLDHPRLAALDERDARRQLADSRDALEQHLGRDVRLLAYPYGTASTVSPRDRELALETGYRAAFMDMIGPIERDSDVYALPRAKVLGTDRMMVVAGSLRGGMDLWRRVESRMH